MGVGAGYKSRLVLNLGLHTSVLQNTWLCNRYILFHADSLCMCVGILVTGYGSIVKVHVVGLHPESLANS